MSTFETYIGDAALRNGIPHLLLRAIVTVESRSNPWAMRYEAHYRWLWNIETNQPFRGKLSDYPLPPREWRAFGVSRDTEVKAQKTSWGLMQIMGAVGRELGFDRPFLTELVDPQVNLEYGCRHLYNMYRRFGGWEEAAVAYNAGSPRRNKEGQWVNQVYLDRLRSAGWQP